MRVSVRHGQGCMEPVDQKIEGYFVCCYLIVDAGHSICNHDAQQQHQEHNGTVRFHRLAPVKNGTEAEALAE